MKPTKLNLTMIVPPEDVLLNELTDIKGGASGLKLCFKGCCGGDSKGKDKTTNETHENLTAQP